MKKIGFKLRPKLLLYNNPPEWSVYYQQIREKIFIKTTVPIINQLVNENHSRKI